MATLSAGQVASFCGGRITSGSSDLLISSYSLDSRATKKGELFFAIRGERLDGHDFVADALEKGALGAVVEEGRVPSHLDRETLIIEVADTPLALQELAASVRKNSRVNLIGISGSTGKTTTKDITYTLLSSRFKAKKSPGNFNSLYGLPLALLALEEGDELFVAEMGMSRPGELKRLCEIAEPEIGVLTNIYPVHQEFFPGIKAIAGAKRELLDGLSGERIAVLNRDDPLIREISGDFSGRMVWFGIKERAEVTAVDITTKGLSGTALTIDYGGKKGNCFLPLIGFHNVVNLLAALAVARALSLGWEEVLPRLSLIEPSPMRGAVIRFRQGITVIDESYNSNPKALEMVLSWFAGLTDFSRKIAVLGDMLELGDIAEEAHREAGRRVASSGISLLIGVGELSQLMVEEAIASGIKEDAAIHFPDAEKAAEFLTPRVKEGDIILVKGSRGINTDIVISRLRSRYHEEGTDAL
jgi:UDP-N-acetylmuramoyl-tripeptide--D-alanyl-D-alanine ligase